MMDTKTLYDACVDAGIDISNPDNDVDAVDLWLYTCLADREFMENYLGDFLMELTTKDAIKAISQYATDALKAADLISIASPFIVKATMGRVIQTYSAMLGSMVVNVLEAETKKVIAQLGNIWWEDVVNYHLDMREAAKEDAAAFRRGA